MYYSQVYYCSKAVHTLHIMCKVSLHTVTVTRHNPYMQNTHVPQFFRKYRNRSIQRCIPNTRMHMHAQINRRAITPVLCISACMDIHTTLHCTVFGVHAYMHQAYTNALAHLAKCEISLHCMNML